MDRQIENNRNGDDLFENSGHFDDDSTDNWRKRLKPGRRVVGIFKIDERGKVGGCKMGSLGFVVLCIAAWLIYMGLFSNRSS